MRKQKSIDQQIAKDSVVECIETGHIETNKNDAQSTPMLPSFHPSAFKVTSQKSKCFSSI